MSNLVLIPVIFCVLYLGNYIRDLETVNNNSYETCIVKSSSVDRTRGQKANHYYLMTTDGKELVLTKEQYRIAKDENIKDRVRVYYLKNSKTVLKIEPYGE